MLEAASVALHAVRVSEVTGGETALVIGAGMIGLLTLQAARALGCARVFITDVDATRLDWHGRSAQMRFCMPPARNWSHEVHRADRRPRRRSCAMRPSAAMKPSTAAIDCTRKGGTVTLIGNIQPEVTLPLQKVVTRQIRLQGSCASAGEYPQAIELIASGKIKVRPSSPPSLRSKKGRAGLSGCMRASRT